MPREMNGNSIVDKRPFEIKRASLSRNFQMEV